MAQISDGEILTDLIARRLDYNIAWLHLGVYQSGADYAVSKWRRHLASGINL